MRSSRIPSATDLAILKANGALCFDTDKGKLWAIFDDEGVSANFDDRRINSTSPQITCRVCDVEDLELTEPSARLSYRDRKFTVRQAIPDGTGMITLVLDADE